MQREYFARAQSMQHHEAHDGQIAGGAETGPETCDLIDRQRRHHTFGSAHAQLAQGRTPTSEAQGRTSPIPMLKSWPRLSHSSGGFEPQYTFGDADPAI